jgi:hypothetical protein
MFRFLFKLWQKSSKVKNKKEFACKKEVSAKLDFFALCRNEIARISTGGGFILGLDLLTVLSGFVCSVYFFCQSAFSDFFAACRKVLKCE